MDDPTPNLDHEIKQVQLENLRIDTDVKRIDRAVKMREFERGRGLLMDIFANRVGAGAAITFWVALSSGIFSLISSYISSSSQENIEKLKLRTSLILEVAHGDSLETAALKLAYLLGTCQLDDPDGHLHAVLNNLKTALANNP